MKKIPFNLNYYLKNHPMVVTRSDKKVRILATDLRGSYPICFAFECEVELLWGEGKIDVDFTRECCANGRFSMFPDEENDNEYDLFMLVH